MNKKNIILSLIIIVFLFFSIRNFKGLKVANDLEGSFSNLYSVKSHPVLNERRFVNDSVQREKKIRLEVVNQLFESLKHSSEFYKTIVAICFNQKIVLGRNIIFNAAFHIAWNKLTFDVLSDRIRLENKDENIVRLNKNLITKEDLLYANYLAFASTGKDKIPDKVRSSIKAKYNIDYNYPDDFKAKDIGVFSIIFKYVEFAQSFDQLDEPIKFNGWKKVKCFGVEGEDASLYTQVKVINYKDEDNFVLSISTSSLNEFIYLAKIKPKDNIIETVQEALFQREKYIKRPVIQKNDVVKIPKITISTEHIFKNLSNKKILNKEFKRYTLKDSREVILFKVDGKGFSDINKVRSTGFDIKRKKIIVKKEEPQQPSKRFVFDKPFLLFLKREDAQYPYFAIWIDNTELLEEI